MIRRLFGWLKLTFPLRDRNHLPREFRKSISLYRIYLLNVDLEEALTAPDYQSLAKL